MCDIPSTGTHYGMCQLGVGGSEEGRKVNTETDIIPQLSTSQHTGFSTKLPAWTSPSVLCLLYLIKLLLFAMLCLLSFFSKHWTCTQISCGASKNQDPTLTMQTSYCPAIFKIVKRLMTSVITPFFGLLRKQL